MIGHQVLLNSGDSTSVVLPIDNENGNYRIRFESEFELDPGQIESTVSKVFKETDISGRYIVEVIKCSTEEVVHSFEIGNANKADVLPCKSRNQTKGCYSILFTLLNTDLAITDEFTKTELDEGELNYSWIGLFLLVVITVVLIVKRRSHSRKNLNLIQIGAFQFDEKNTELLIDGQKIELSSKESDLLSLLYEAVNTTVEREVILNMVWGDNGDYIGRILDVFISKLRKKLEPDLNIKIVNIRGVGYKLVLND